jgi:hypothetical protein
MLFFNDVGRKAFDFAAALLRVHCLPVHDPIFLSLLLAFPLTFREPEPVPMHFQKIVNDAVEPPLNAHLLFSSQTESIKAEARTDVGEDGFDGSHSSSIDQLARYGVDLLPHLLREGLGLLFGLSGKVGELASFGLIGFLQALRPELARDAISLGSLELDGVSSIMDQVAVPVHAFACRQMQNVLSGLTVKSRGWKMMARLNLLAISLLNLSLYRSASANRGSR